MNKHIAIICITIGILLGTRTVYGDEITVENGNGESDVVQNYSLNYNDKDLKDSYKVVLEWNTSSIDVNMDRTGVWNSETEMWDYTYLPTDTSIGKEASFTFTNKSSKTLNVAASLMPNTGFALDDDFVVRIGHKDITGNMSNDYVENKEYNLTLGSKRVALDALSKRTIMTKIIIKDSKFVGLDTTNDGVLGYYHFDISANND